MVQVAEELQTDTTKLRAAVMKALSGIGHRNGHAKPQGSTDFLHELYIAQEGKQFFEKMYKNALDLAKEMHQESLNELSGGESCTLEADPVYSLNVSTKQPSSRLDAKAFTNELRKLGVPLETIEKAREKATKETAVPKSFTVVFNKMSSS